MPPIATITTDFEQVSGLRAPLEADADRIDVWLVSLTANESRLRASMPALSAEEIARAERFLRRADRDQFVLSRGLLRRLLGLYCQVAPSDIRFSVESGGKPALEPGRGPVPTFNLSHSSGKMLVGISRDRSVGVDIEARDPDTDPLRIARRYFSGPEAADIASAPEASRHERFLQYWVAKEAALKAAGVGLRHPLDALRVNFSSDRTEADVESFDPGRLPPDLKIRMLAPGPGWQGAIASRGCAWRCRPMPACGPIQDPCSEGERKCPGQ